MPHENAPPDLTDKKAKTMTLPGRQHVINAVKIATFYGFMAKGEYAAALKFATERNMARHMVKARKALEKQRDSGI